MGCCQSCADGDAAAPAAAPPLTPASAGAPPPAPPLSPSERAAGVEAAVTLVVRSPGKQPCAGRTSRGARCRVPVPREGSGFCHLHARGARGAARPLALREAAARDGQRSARKDAAARAAALTLARKARVFVRVRGVESIARLQSRLSDLVRDHGARLRRDELRAALGEGAYYTRARALSKAAPAEGHLEVDHVFECQMLGHAIVQTEAFHELGWLQAVDLSSARTHQPSGVVRSGLEALYNAQNCVDDASFFNLRLMDKSLNVTKGNVVKEWLAGRYAGGEAARLTGLRAGFRQSSAVRSALISPEEGDDLAAALHAAFTRVEGPYLERLEAARERVPATAATLAERTAHDRRYAGLCETVSLLLDELEAID